MLFFLSLSVDQNAIEWIPSLYRQNKVVMCQAHSSYNDAVAEQLRGDTAFAAKRFLSANQHYSHAIALIGTNSVSTPGSVTIDDTGLMLVAADDAFRKRKYSVAAQLRKTVLETRLDLFRKARKCK